MGRPFAWTREVIALEFGLVGPLCWKFTGSIIWVPPRASDASGHTPHELNMSGCLLTDPVEINRTIGGAGGMKQFPTGAMMISHQDTVGLLENPFVKFQ